MTSCPGTGYTSRQASASATLDRYRSGADAMLLPSCARANSWPFSDNHARLEIILVNKSGKPIAQSLYLSIGVMLRLIIGDIAVCGAQQCFDKFFLIHRPVRVPRSVLYA